MSTPKTHDQQVSVLHIGKYFPPDPGGMETYLHDLMVSSLQQGTRSIALVHRSQLGVISTHERYQASGLELNITRAATWLRFLFTPISPAFPWLIRRLIKQHRPSLLHLHLPNPSAFWALTSVAPASIVMELLRCFGTRSKNAGSIVSHPVQSSSRGRQDAPAGHVATTEL